MIFNTDLDYTPQEAKQVDDDEDKEGAFKESDLLEIWPNSIVYRTHLLHVYFFTGMRSALIHISKCAQH